MPRTSVRAAIQSYLDKADVEFLTTIYAHPPKITQEGDIIPQDDPGISSGAVVYIHFPEQSERRMSGGPPGASSPGTPAKKYRMYTVGLICVFRSMKSDTQDVGADADTFMDSLTAAIQADRTAGTGAATNTPPGDGTGTIQVWGEGDTNVGTPDVHVKQGMPKTVKGQISQVFSTVEILVGETIDT